uniref:G-patch domain-containing protein n=1 Tax=Chromera velia CCMP2878 TaxID=1169474 RepID=A0A0G4FEA3_9ALVE|eukprot:Cvel_16573.t1-p1 / transcript=Cvel_16573.t1 / gene=Cvel_16573 / organism=Chromera_velia_CCMP2878 / gene_product=hypothetical protein / transcript_product=hypothetical protein / location=Cvel_scaffold1282:36989-43508(+) / protein_length=508 / sequence_SO=supercontig / SO=protein_coding / is_pseudo=false
MKQHVKWFRYISKILEDNFQGGGEVRTVPFDSPVSGLVRLGPLGVASETKSDLDVGIFFSERCEFAGLVQKAVQLRTALLDFSVDNSSKRDPKQKKIRPRQTGREACRHRMETGGPGDDAAVFAAALLEAQWAKACGFAKSEFPFLQLGTTGHTGLVLVWLQLTAVKEAEEVSEALPVLPLDLDSLIGPIEAFTALRERQKVVRAAQRAASSAGATGAPRLSESADDRRDGDKNEEVKENGDSGEFFDVLSGASEKGRADQRDSQADRLTCSGALTEKDSEDREETESLDSYASAESAPDRRFQRNAIISREHGALSERNSGDREETESLDSYASAESAPDRRFQRNAITSREHGVPPSKVAERLMINRGFRYGKGLGATTQGVKALLYFVQCGKRVPGICSMPTDCAPGSLCIYEREKDTLAAVETTREQLDDAEEVVQRKLRQEAQKDQEISRLKEVAEEQKAQSDFDLYEAQAKASRLEEELEEEKEGREERRTTYLNGISEQNQ